MNSHLSQKLLVNNVRRVIRLKVNLIYLLAIIMLSNGRLTVDESGIVDIMIPLSSLMEWL